MTTNLFARREVLGIRVLQYGLASMYLWFGFSQLFGSADWVSYVPDWTTALIPIPPAALVMLNGAFEVLAGALLAAGILVRPVAFLLALHLALITVDIGVTAIGVRDFGLTAATLALAFLYPEKKKETYLSS